MLRKCALSLVSLLVGTVAARAITFSPSSGPDPDVGTYPGASIFYNFDDKANTSIGSFSSTPLNAGTGVGSGNYMAIASGQSVTLTFVNAVQYVGFLVGSLDGSSNSIQVFGANGLLISLNGNNIGGERQTGYLNISSPDELITSVVFSSSINYFEMDNFAYIAAPTSQTPLPAALPLFGTILAGGGLVAWRRKRKASKLAIS